MDYSTQIILEAVDRKMVPANVKELYKQEMLEYTYIHIPEFIAKYLQLVYIWDCKEEYFLDLDDEVCVREGIHPWFKLKTNILSTDVGYHTYRMKFKNLDSEGDDVVLYFAYRMSDADTNEPYIYMSRNSDSSSSSGSSSSGSGSCPCGSYVTRKELMDMLKEIPNWDNI